MIQVGSSGYTHTIWVKMGIGQSYGHLPIIRVTLWAYVAPMGFVLPLLIEKLIANVFQDLQVLTLGNGAQVVKGISLQKVAKAKTEV